MSHPSTAPVEVGEQYPIEITEIGREGDGVGYISGFVIFVSETQIGDSMTIEIENVHESFAIGSVVERHG